MSHTKGLLHITAPDDALLARGISDDTRTCVAFCDRDDPEQARADARRLVAAWNACAGIATADLEYGTSLDSLLADAAKLKRERDEAVEALKELVEVATLRGDNDLPHPADDALLWTARMQDAWNDAEAVLAKIGGQNG